ncbi:hypothetical protein M0812_16272 [Anaeramoeba flamelloides]|uniref:Uncharacterized protein n=1 Tax=Anaeramoeba flamelloides TaxID=1746091 RepID=A0AAV7ZDY3_9EUKA|nr:hypothetical protein M0812_16272 [Anaeramoeba flamelloides]
MSKKQFRSKKEISKPSQANKKKRVIPTWPPLIIRLFLFLILNGNFLGIVYSQYKVYGSCGLWVGLNVWNLCLVFGGFGILLKSSLLTLTGALFEFFPTVFFFIEIGGVFGSNSSLLGILPPNLLSSKEILISAIVLNSHHIWTLFLFLISVTWSRSVKFVHYLFASFVAVALTIFSRFYTPLTCEVKPGVTKYLNINMSHEFSKYIKYKQAHRFDDETPVIYLTYLLCAYVFVFLLFSFLSLKSLVIFGTQSVIKQKSTKPSTYKKKK